MSFHIPANLMVLAVLAGSSALYYFYFFVVTRKLQELALARRWATLQAVLKAWWGRPLLALVCLAVGFATCSMVVGVAR